MHIHTYILFLSSYTPKDITRENQISAQLAKRTLSVAWVIYVYVNGRYAMRKPWHVTAKPFKRSEPQYASPCTVSYKRLRTCACVRMRAQQAKEKTKWLLMYSSS